MVDQNTYYNNGYGYGHNDRRNDALPAIPPTSPFDDQQYPYLHSQPSQSSYGPAHDRMETQSDPFADDDAVPLRKYRPKHDSQASVAPMVTPVYDDPFVRDIEPSKRRSKRDSRRDSRRDVPLNEGWFTGRITWVCYFLTVVQIAVFLAEIIRNGKAYTLL